MSYSVPAGTSAGIAVAVADPVSGDLVDLAAPPTVVIRDGGGVDVDAGVAAPSDATGVYTYVVPGTALSVAALDEYAISWSGSYVGGAPFAERDVLATAGGPGRYFTIADLRGYDRAVVETPALVIEMARAYAEQRIDGVAQVSFVPRARRHRVDLRPVRARGRMLRKLWLPDAEVRGVYAITVDGVAPTSGYLLDGDGLLPGDGGDAWSGDVVEVWYSHGLDYPPEPVKRAAKMLAMEALSPSTLNQRMTLQSVGNEAFRVSIADRRTGSTGNPEVDAVCASFGRQRPSAG